jgi:hypothetical protein
MIGRRPLFVTDGIFAAFDLLSPIEVLMVKNAAPTPSATQLVKLSGELYQLYGDFHHEA